MCIDDYLVFHVKALVTWNKLYKCLLPCYQRDKYVYQILKFLSRETLLLFCFILIKLSE